MTPNSPFMIHQGFLTDGECNDIVRQMKRHVAFDEEGFALPDEFHQPPLAESIFEKFKRIIPELEQHYGIEYRGNEHALFQQFPAGMKGNAAVPHHAENSRYLRKKWVRVGAADITGYLWLNDYAEHENYKPDMVYGGKVEFPQYGFSLVPQKGTLILFPAGPHFIKAISSVLVGTLYQVKLNLVAQTPMFYDPTKFEIDKNRWFDAAI